MLILRDNRHSCTYKTTYIVVVFVYFGASLFGKRHVLRIPPCYSMINIRWEYYEEEKKWDKGRTYYIGGCEH